MVQAEKEAQGSAIPGIVVDELIGTCLASNAVGVVVVVVVVVVDMTMTVCLSVPGPTTATATAATTTTAPVDYTIGKKLLQKMGWRQGQGVGSRQTRYLLQERKQSSRTRGSMPSYLLWVIHRRTRSDRDQDSGEDGEEGMVITYRHLVGGWWLI